jgi:hypothetical protein
MAILLRLTPESLRKLARCVIIFRKRLEWMGASFCSFPVDVRRFNRRRMGQRAVFFLVPSSQSWLPLLSCRRAIDHERVRGGLPRGDADTVSAKQPASFRALFEWPPLLVFAACAAYVSRQVLDIMIALKTYAGNSRYLLPSRYDADAPTSRATFNRVTYAVAERAKAEGLPLEPFTVHDLRRTGSTLLNELGFNSDWIEKCLAHEDGRSSRGVYNEAEFEVQRRHMMQEWSDIIDAWVEGKKYVAALIPPSMPILEPNPAL